MWLSFVSALVLAPARATAQLETRWDTAPACVAAAELGPRVASFTGEPVGPLRLWLGASQRGDDWRISLRLEDPTQRLARTIEGRDCDTLTDAVALIVAVRIDALATAAAVPSPTPDPIAPPVPAPVGSPPPPVVDPGPPPGPAAAPTPSTPRAPHPRPRPHPRLGTAVGAELGVLPRGAATFELDAGLGWRRAELDLGALASFGPPALVAQAPSIGGRFQLTAGLVRGCGVLGRGRWELPLCGAVEVGDLRARGTGLTRPRRVHALWLALAAGARPRWRPVPPLALGGFVELVAPMIRPRFSTGEGLMVHQIPSVAARLGLAIELRLP